MTDTRTNAHEVMTMGKGGKYDAGTVAGVSDYRKPYVPVPDPPASADQSMPKPHTWGSFSETKSGKRAADK